MGLAGGDNKRNIEAIALLALFLSFASFSFINLITRPVACFPGDIGTTKCPITSGLIHTGDQIKFDRSLVTNTTATSSTSLTSSTFTISPNETIVVTTESSILSANVTLVTDALLTVFTFAIREGSSGNGFLEVWAGRYLGSVSATDAVTVTWNTADTVMFVSTLYKNVLGLGNINGTASAALVSSLSTLLTSGTSGSWVFGAGGASIGTASCQNLQSGAGFVQRVSTCSGMSGSIMDMMTVADNATVLPNFQKLSYPVSVSTMVPIGIAEVELLSVDREPNNPNFNNFCTSTNGLCVTTQYSMNIVNKATGANALNQVLAPGTAYCTGITTAALTTSSSPKALDAWGSYGGVSLNTTGLKLDVAIIISTTVPQTTFGTGGTCTASSTLATVYFATSGALGATNSYVASLSANLAVVSANTVYYASITIVAVGFSGHANFDQIVNQVYSTGNIFMQEQK